MRSCGREQRRLRGEISFNVDYCKKGCRGGRRSTWPELYLVHYYSIGQRFQKTILMPDAMCEID
jgi:hypothetical protein